MQEGIMVHDGLHQDWKIWIGQEAYETCDGMHLEIWIWKHYFNAWLGNDGDWFITLEEDTSFDLRVLEIYKVRVMVDDFIPKFDVPF